MKTTVNLMGKERKIESTSREYTEQIMQQSNWIKTLDCFHFTFSPQNKSSTSGLVYAQGAIK